MMLNMDPPDHTKLRKIVNKGFTPRRSATLMDAPPGGGRGRSWPGPRRRASSTSSTEVAAELPLIAIAEFLGVPREERKRIFDLSNRLIGFDDPEYRDDGAGSGRRGHRDVRLRPGAWPPGSGRSPATTSSRDLLTAEVDGDSLSDLEFNLFFMLLCVAGNETTRNAISHGMHALLEHPDQVRKLAGRPVADRRGRSRRSSAGRRRSCTSGAPPPSP